MARFAFLMIWLCLAAPLVVCADAPKGEAGSAASPATAAAGDHGGSHEQGLPGFNRDLALWSLITFGVFLFVLKKVAWVPLTTALNEREAKIAGEIAAAEQSRLQAEALLKEYEAKLAQAQEQVKELLAEARRDADHTKAEIIATASREAEATRARAVSEIERARDGALNDLFDFMASNVAGAAERVVGRSLSGDDHDRLVREALAELNVRRN